MKELNYTIRDEIGLHSRPAGLLSKKAACFKSAISISNGSKKVDAKSILSIMQLAAKSKQTIYITIEGEDEETALQEISTFLQENI